MYATLPLLFFQFFHLILTTKPAEIKFRKDSESSSLSSSSAANQTAASTSESQAAGPTMELDFNMEHGEELEMDSDWVNGSLLCSGAYFLCILSNFLQ